VVAQTVCFIRRNIKTASGFDNSAFAQAISPWHGISLPIFSEVLLLREGRISMRPVEIEQLLFEHAIQTRIRPPLAERLSNLRHNRAISAAVVASAALACTMAMTTRNTADADVTHDYHHSQMTNSNALKQPVLQSPEQLPAPDSDELAMSRNSD
jgi:hypothetical protein